MFFPLFSKVFTEILKINELNKIFNKILPSTCLDNNHLPGQFYVPNSSDFSTIPLLTLLKKCPWGQRSFLTLNFKKHFR